MGWKNPSIWPAGTRQPSPSSDEGLAPNYYAASLHVDVQEPGLVLCCRRTVSYVFLGSAMIAIGAAVTAYASIAHAEKNVFFGVAGLIVVALGIMTLLAKPSLLVDARRQVAVLSFRIIGMGWQLQLSTADVSDVVIDRKGLVTIEGTAFQYVVCLQTVRGEQWPLDSSSNHQAQQELGGAVARCLNLPLRDYGEAESPLERAGPEP